MDQIAVPAVTQLYHRLLHMCMPNNREVLVLSPSKQISMQFDSDKHCSGLIKSCCNHVTAFSVQDSTWPIVPNAPFQ